LSNNRRVRRIDIPKAPYYFIQSFRHVHLQKSDANNRFTTGQALQHPHYPPQPQSSHLSNGHSTVSTPLEGSRRKSISAHGAPSGYLGGTPTGISTHFVLRQLTI